MKILISVDIEGIAGVVDGEQGRKGNPEYETARRLMTEEANAAVRGALAGGARDVIVTDSHGQMRNILPEALHPDARLISGKPRPLSMAQGLTENCAGLILVGWHARAGKEGVLAHTISGACYHWITINDVPCGEATIYAGLAASWGVPLLLASGDDRLAAEIEAQFPGAFTVVVKQAITTRSACSMAPARAQSLIETATRDAVARAREVKPVQPFAAPYTVMAGLKSTHLADGVCLLPSVERVEPTVVSFTVGKLDDAIGMLSAISIMAAGLSV